MDYLEIRELYHADLLEKEKARLISEFEIYNKDFLDDLPYQVRNVLDSLMWRFRQEDWFLEAWEKYRQHVLEAGLGGKINMPGYIFNPYLERYVEEHSRESNNNLGECRYSDMEIGEYLAHHGIKGQKWGIRRYQNEDGSLTAEGKKRYGVNGDGQMSKEGKKLYKQDVKATRREIAGDYTDMYDKNFEKYSKELYGNKHWTNMTKDEITRVRNLAEKDTGDALVKKYGNRSVQEFEKHDKTVKTGIAAGAAALAVIGTAAATAYVLKDTGLGNKMGSAGGKVFDNLGKAAFR
ncbi:MAG: hypothetical protein IKR19_00560 [Acholeplasmatales bacterium]|nr:hypothetical protein [Acholeplasmatales bacterium]